MIKNSIENLKRHLEICVVQISEQDDNLKYNIFILWYSPYNLLFYLKFGIGKHFCSGLSYSWDHWDFTILHYPQTTSTFKVVHKYFMWDPQGGWDSSSISRKRVEQNNIYVFNGLLIISRIFSVRECSE